MKLNARVTRSRLLRNKNSGVVISNPQPYLTNPFLSLCLQSGVSLTRSSLTKKKRGVALPTYISFASNTAVNGIPMPLSALLTASLSGPSNSAMTYCADCEFGADATGGGAVVFLRESRTIATKAAKTITVAAMNA